MRSATKPFPQILTSIRQKTEREREIGYLFRGGRAAEALEMKQQDGTAVLVAGGREATIEHVARLWCERLKANDGNPDFALTVSAPTNADAREIGAAIRAHRRRAGDLGDDVKIVRATDRGGDTYELPLAGRHDVPSQGSVNACTPLPLPSGVVPEPTNSILPTGVAPELTDPGIGKVFRSTPDLSS